MTHGDVRTGSEPTAAVRSGDEISIVDDSGDEISIVDDSDIEILATEDSSPTKSNRLRVATLGACIVALILGVVSVFLSGAGDSSPEMLSGESFELQMTEFDFSSDEIVVQPGTGVTFELINAGDIQHNFGTSEDDVSDRILPGESGIFEAGVLEGETVFYCLIPGHREAGMEFTVVVSSG